MLVEQFGADVKGAATSDEAFGAVREGDFDLVLINRVFDANNESGFDLIKRLKSNEETKDIPVMLMSNYSEAQEAAVALGARPGFGKNALMQPRTREVLASVLSAVHALNSGNPK